MLPPYLNMQIMFFFCYFQFVNLFKWWKLVHNYKRKLFTLESKLPPDLQIKAKVMLHIHFTLVSKLQIQVTCRGSSFLFVLLYSPIKLPTITEKNFKVTLNTHTSILNENQYIFLVFVQPIYINLQCKICIFRKKKFTIKYFPQNLHNQIKPNPFKIIPPLVERGLYCNHLVCPSVRLSVRSHFHNRYLSFYWKKLFYI